MCIVYVFVCMYYVICVLLMCSHFMFYDFVFIFIHVTIRDEVDNDNCEQRLLEGEGEQEENIDHLEEEGLGVLIGPPYCPEPEAFTA